jgi:hypothetical protein
MEAQEIEPDRLERGYGGGEIALRGIARGTNLSRFGAGAASRLMADRRKRVQLLDSRPSGRRVSLESGDYAR